MNVFARGEAIAVEAMRGIRCPWCNDLLGQVSTGGFEGTCVVAIKCRKCCRVVREPVKR